jgi:hypothetical protein
MIGKPGRALKAVQVVEQAVVAGVGWQVDNPDLLPRRLPPVASILGHLVGERYFAGR